MEKAVCAVLILMLSSTPSLTPENIHLDSSDMTFKCCSETPSSIREHCWRAPVLSGSSSLS